jgi:hypothetical protein
VVAFVDNDNIPGTALHDLLKVVSEHGLVNARNNEPIVTDARIRRAACYPTTRIQLELLSKLEGDISDEARWRKVQNAHARSSLKKALNDQSSFNCLPQAHLVSDQNLVKIGTFQNMLHETNLVHQYRRTLGIQTPLRILPNQKRSERARQRPMAHPKPCLSPRKSLKKKRRRRQNWRNASDVNA